jgi:hypothetical protein
VAAAGSVNDDLMNSHMLAPLPWWSDVQVDDHKAVALRAMATQDADNQALEQRLHSRMAR